MRLEIHQAIAVSAMCFMSVSGMEPDGIVGDVILPRHKDRIARKSTFANPIDLQYRMRPEKTGHDFREGADPDVVMWDGRYWLFASKSGGYYVSNDLVSWRLVHTDDLSIMFRDACKDEVRSLDVGQDYWWKIEAFNASGFSAPTAIHCR